MFNVRTLFICLALLGLSTLYADYETRRPARVAGKLKEEASVGGEGVRYFLRTENKGIVNVKEELKVLRALDGKKVELIGAIVDKPVQRKLDPPWFMVTEIYELEDDDFIVTGSVIISDSLKDVEEKDVKVGYLIYGEKTSIPYSVSAGGHGTFRLPLLRRAGVKTARYNIVAWIDKNDNGLADNGELAAKTSKIYFTFKNDKWLDSKNEEVSSPAKDIEIDFGVKK